MHAKLLLTSLTLCNPMDYSPPRYSVQGIVQARTVEWVAVSSSRGSSLPRDRTLLSYIFLHWQAGSLPLMPPGKTRYGLFTKWSDMKLLKKNIASRNFYQVIVIKFRYKKEAKWSTEMASSSESTLRMRRPKYWRDLTHQKRLWCWEGLGAGGEGDDRGWDGWMASRTRWTWVWVNSGSWWWTGRPGVLQFMGSQRVRHN